MIRSLSKRPRMWSCSHCPQKNDPAKKKCGGCGVGRATKKRSLDTRAGLLWAAWIRRGGACYVCGGTVGVQAAHIIGRAQSRAVRWHPFNGIPLCAGPGSKSCHTRFDKYEIDREALIQRFLGAEKWRELRDAATSGKKLDYLEAIATLRALKEAA